MGDLFFFNRASAVGDRDQAAVFFIGKRNPDVAAVPVLDGVFQDVLQHLFQPCTIAGKKDVGILLYGKIRMQGRELFVVQPLDPTHQFGKIELTHRHFQIEKILLGSGDDIGHILLDFLDVVGDTGEGLLFLFFTIVDPLVQRFCIELDGRKRRLDVVRERKDQGLFVLLHLQLSFLVGLEIVAEHVDAPEEFTEELVLLGFDRCAQISPRQFHGKVAHGVEGAKNPAPHIDQYGGRDEKACEKTDIHVDQGTDVGLGFVLEAQKRAGNFPYLVWIVNCFFRIEIGDADDGRIIVHVKTIQNGAGGGKYIPAGVRRVAPMQIQGDLTGFVLRFCLQCRGGTGDVHAVLPAGVLFEAAEHQEIT